MLIRYGKADGKMSKEAKNTYEDITIAVECSIKDDILPNKYFKFKKNI